MRAGLAIAFEAGVTRWGEAARALVAEVGGRWPSSAEAQLGLCRFVHYRLTPDGPCWTVDDLAGFSAATGAPACAGGVQLALDLRAEGPFRERPAGRRR